MGPYSLVEVIIVGIVIVVVGWAIIDFVSKLLKR